MSNLLKSKLFLGVMVVAVMFVGALALTAEASYTHTGLLKMGMSSSQVTSLQQTLNAGGFTVATTGAGSAGMESMYFGAKTKAAVMAFQAANGLKADGVVGAMTGAKLGGAVSGNFPAGCTSAAGFSTTTGMACNSVNANTFPAGCTNASGYSPTTGASCSGAGTSTGPLSGMYGTIADMNTLSSYNNEEVGSGQQDVKVLGFDVEASNDGDIALNSMKVRFDATGNNAADSDRLTDYINSVTIWQGSTKVGTALASDFSKDSTGIYTKTVSLSNSVVRADKIEKFYISVDAASNLDSGDIDSDSWTIALDNVRFTDGSGVVSTETTAIPSDIDWDAAGDGVAISFVSLSSASDTELKISLNSTPDSQVVKVSTTNNTDSVTLLKGKLKLDGTSDVWLDEMPITFVTVGGASLDDVTSSVILTLGANTYTESTGTNCTPTCASNTTAVVTFDNLDYTVSAGSTVNFTISADINDIEAATFDEGDTLKASLLTTNRDDIVAENSGGDQLTDATEMTGSAVGEYQAFYSKGMNVKLVGSPTAVISHVGDIVGSGAGDDDQGTFTMTFDVTAFGSDIYVDGTAPSLTGAGAILDLNIAATAGTPVLTAATITSPTGATMTGTVNADSRFKVEDGTTQRFTVTAVVTPSTTADATIAVSITDIVYALTDVTGTSSYTFNLDDFKTPDLYLNAN